jgi:transcriptional regulator with XRE-family HTH domain
MDEALLLSNFGDRVRTARLALGLSQEKLAFDCGLDRTYISSVERGKRNVSLINIHKLAGALEISPTALLVTKGGSK